MKKSKTVMAIIALYTVQFIISCCPNEGVIESTISNMEVRAFNISGDSPEEIVDTTPVNTKDFIMTVFLRSETAQVASNIKMGSFGFSTAMATSCPNPEYIFKNDIETIEILVEDTLSSETIDVTDKFRRKDHNDDLISLSEFIQVREDWEDSFEMVIVDDTEIPSSSLFTINIRLTSNELLSFKTNDIVFN